MRFAEQQWLWGVFFALLLGGVFLVQGLRVAASRSKFGEEERVLALMTARPGIRRAISAVLVCLAAALAFVAAAQPQYGKGTRVLPATNLDVVLVLDYSKSMYARDVSPSRIARAKVEVGKMVRELGGARFGAVAFAGESISFPLTSDGAAIAQFFRGMEPNDMPVGGTAIARALENARRLLERDPLSKNHEKVLVLITDGEDLEGDPVQTAQAAASNGIRVEVVQIGGQTPEPIPEVDDHGAVKGMRRDTSGKIMTTQLSPEGEAQLAGVAAAGGGELVRAADGEVGVEEMKNRLRRLMTEELSERVETVYADIFHYPLALAVLLLMIEVWIGSSKKRVRAPEPPPGQRKRRRLRRLESAAHLLVVSVAALGSLGCEAADPIFERESPVVNEAIALLSEGDPAQASERLIEYLETGPCEAGVIGVGDRARQYTDASYDLALAFSALARAGAAQAAGPGAAAPGAAPPSGAGMPSPGGTVPPQGAAPGMPPGPASAEPSAELIAQIDCAIRLLSPIAQNKEQPTALRARSHYLQGNLELLRTEFAGAVAAYDAALLLTPGVAEGSGDALGILVAYNRALALRLQKQKEEQEKKDEEENQESNQDEQDGEEGEDGEESDDQEKSEDESEDGSDQEEKGEEEESEDESEGEQNESDSEEESGEDEQSSDSDEPGPGEEQEPEPQPQPSEQDNSPSAARDERMLDLLEQAPTLQQHEAQQQKGARIRGRATMEDK